MFRRVLLIAALIVTIPVTAYGMTAHEQTMSYILSNQDTPQKPGDYLYNGAHNKPQLLETTGYCTGTHGSHGDRMKKGYCAFTQAHYGSAVSLYKAVPTENGYEIGEYLGLLEVRDCGYGRETGEGESSIRPDKNSEGTIEKGLSVDVYFPTLAECKEWMQKTNGMVFAVVVPDAKG